MKQLARLHEEFIAAANRPMTFGALPIDPRQPEVPIVALERWRECDGALHKTYKFREPDKRDEFVTALLSYERETQHNAQIRIDHDEVALRLQTKDIERVSELDREYARFADVVFKDLVSRPDVVSSDAELGLTSEVGSDDGDETSDF